MLQERLNVVQHLGPDRLNDSSGFPQLGPLITTLEEADLFEKKLRDPSFMNSVVDVLSKEGNHSKTSSFHYYFYTRSSKVK